MNPPPEDDSEDLTDPQVAQAVETKSAEHLAEHLTLLSCTICGARPELWISHALRRRAPHLYSRTHVRCPAGHEETYVFTVDWLKN